MTQIPRPEHPQPQMKREHWKNLNGEWDFSFDFGCSGIDQKWQEGKTDWEKKILVPFCPESDLSGIGYKDFIPGVWYHRTITLTGEELKGDLLLHFGAVDYDARVWINGVEAGRHQGGYVSFTFNITKLVKEGENDITLFAADDVRGGKQPKGKQSHFFYSRGCDYTRTTGIWQTVWLEWVPESYIEKVQYYPNLAEATLGIKAVVKGQGTLEAKAFYEGEPCGSVSAKSEGGTVTMTLPLSRLEKWEPGHGRLYDLTLTYGEDKVESYFGMREVRLDGEKFLINDKSVFQRLVLDQGFYPDGIYTAPTEEALVKDVELSMAAGFNGARLHQKVFEPLFLYHCDKAGYLVWGEQGCWGLDYSNPAALKYFLPEWMEALERDFNHPAIIGWCPLNETQLNQNPAFVRLLATVTRQYDRTRLYIDASGWTHIPGLTDIMDIHDYEQDPAAFAERLAPLAGDGTYNVHRFFGHGHELEARPTFVSEYGGIRWAPSDAAGWGYGQAPLSEQEFLDRFKGLTEVLLFHPRMGALCYTQLTDVEQELNGLYTYDRKPKFDPAFMHAVLTQKAAIEE